jgi:hypothetical protein
MVPAWADIDPVRMGKLPGNLAPVMSQWAMEQRPARRPPAEGQMAEGQSEMLTAKGGRGIVGTCWLDALIAMEIRSWRTGVGTEAADQDFRPMFPGLN